MHFIKTVGIVMDISKVNSVKLKEISKIITGFVPRSGQIIKKEDISSGEILDYSNKDEYIRVKLIQLKHIDNLGNIDWDNLDTIFVKKELMKDYWFIRKNDIVLKTKANLHTAGIVKNDIGDDKIITSSHYSIIRIIDETVYPLYIFLILNSPPIQRYFNKFSMGSFINFLKRDVIEDIVVPLPDIKTQKEYADFVYDMYLREKIMHDLIKDYEKERLYFMEKLYVEMRGENE